MKKHGKYNYQNVTLTETADIVRNLAQEREWSNSHAADYLIAKGAKAETEGVTP